MDELEEKMRLFIRERLRLKLEIDYVGWDGDDVIQIVAKLCLLGKNGESEVISEELVAW